MSVWRNVAVVGLAILSAQANADIKLPPAISSHMVLQRDIAAPVWGTADPGEQVTVEFAGQKKTAKADAGGKWMVKLDPMPTSAEPRVMTVTGSIQNRKSEIQNVLVGEVWVGSGQSNMAGGVAGYAKGDEVLAKAAAAGPYSKIRLLPSRSAGWQEATVDNVNKFSALLFAFGLRLHQELNVPVGLLLGAVGGTPSGNWLSEEAYRSDAACQAEVKKLAPTYPYEQLQKKYE
ncbi:MAG: sialate O-acetylesterase, partial [Planctomycetes bacterium]|nr:sialate O-acetylesterase [Planctomycetota bacterium]